MVRVAAAIVVWALYFLPAFIAVSRDKRDKGAIFTLNLLLGWTIVGWVVALVWSITKDRPRRDSA